jgi:uncharacterized protein (DUF952 family)/putative methionine-R-sulfoxide reductase with GAF domain
MSMSEPLFHIAAARAWERSGDRYAPADFAKEGFVHCSTKEQVIGVANALFRGRADLLLLTIDANRIDAPIRYERASEGAERFPHVYSPLPRAAVLAVEPMVARADGTFEPLVVERCVAKSACSALDEGPGDRVAKAQRAVEAVKSLGPYRWAGLYDVLPAEIAVIAWSGPEAPAHPRFPVTQGLNGACVASRRPVVAQDVAKDPRYLTTIGGTRGEMIQPILDASGAVVGTIDVESERANAFTERDSELLATCAENLAWLWTPRGGRA